MNIKLNKLAKNRLNEKEMQNLKGGETFYEFHIACNKNNVTECCEELCSCSWHPPLLPGTALTSSNGASAAGATMRKQHPPPCA